MLCVVFRLLTICAHELCSEQDSDMVFAPSSRKDNDATSRVSCSKRPATAVVVVEQIVDIIGACRRRTRQDRCLKLTFRVQQRPISLTSD